MIKCYHDTQPDSLVKNRRGQPPPVVGRTSASGGFSQRGRFADKCGSITIVGLIMAFVGIAMVATYLSFSANDMRLTRIAIDQDRTMMVAEAGLDHGVMRLRDVVLEYQFLRSRSWLESEINRIQPPDGVDEYQYLTPDGQVAFKIEVLSDIEDGFLPSGTFRNYEGSYQLFRITCGAINTNNGRSTVLQQNVQAISLSLIRFGVFYTQDLEILPGAPMIFDGPVHSNADMYLGGSSGLRFNQRVTAAGQIFHRRKNDGSRHGTVDIATPTGGALAMNEGNTYFDSDHPSWTSAALDRWEGQIVSREHGVTDLAPPINPMHDPHDIIRRPIEDMDDPGYSENTEREKFANKAALRIELNEDGEIIAIDMHETDFSADFQNQPALELDEDGLPIKDPDTRHYVLDGDGIITTSAQFFDQREQTNQLVIDIYVDRLQSEFPDVYNSTIYGDNAGVVHITGPHDNNWVVRLRNGTEIVPQTGLSFASDLPVYIEGDYNIVSPKPAMVAGDAVTILSRNWQDVRSTQQLSNRQPEDTDVRTVIMTGNTPTTWGNYNGGLENVLRFLENWSGRTLTYRGSIIVLWHSEFATGRWRMPGVYSAPRRDWGYDPMYENRIPPGMTRVFGMEELSWERVTWAQAGW